MPSRPDNDSGGPEILLVGRARAGDRDAFAELVARRQHWVRNLMRRLCGDNTLADDLAQQVFLQAWRTIAQLQRPSRFAPWLKRMAVNVWLQHVRRKDPLEDSREYQEDTRSAPQETGVAMDLDRALGQLAEQERICIVLSYHDRMTHGEIADLTGLPLGTVKSHIRRGTQRLRQFLSAYADAPDTEQA